MSGSYYAVCSRRCTECLFTPDRVVDVPRMQAVLRQCKVRPYYTGPQRGGERDFECHKGTLAGQHIVCRGFYDTYPDHSPAMQIAGRLGLVQFVTPPGEADGSDLGGAPPR